VVVLVRTEGPDCYDAAIKALAGAGQWERARGILDRMLRFVRATTLAPPDLPVSNERD
jgi:pentatricopeptide repeat protein